MTETKRTKVKEGFGLDKNARLESELAAEVEVEKPEPLDPPLPYRVIAFNPIRHPLV